MLPVFLPLLCSPRTSAGAFRLPGETLGHWTIHRCATAAEVYALWPEAGRTDDFWVSADVLAFLADYPQSVDTEAILLEDSRDFSRVLLTAQTFSFSAAGQVSDDVKGTTSSYDFRRRLLSPFSFRVLSLGQFLTSGNYGTDGLRRLSTDEAANLLPAVAETLMQQCKGYAAYMLKDCYPADHPVVEKLAASGHHALPADPVMRISIPEKWASTEDYLASLTSKYRVRYRRARTKLSGISRRRLSADEVAQYRDQLYDCFRQVSSGASFNVASVRADYFPWLARVRQPSAQGVATSMATTPYLAEDQPEGPSSAAAVRFEGYFNEAGVLIGFTTAIPNGNTIHAHFLGLENEYNGSHHLYHNMLFDLLETAIEEGFRTLDYGRTALEIKSSVGALATDYAVLVKARYGWLNRLIPLFTPAVYKAPEWTQRNPFRG